MRQFSTGNPKAIREQLQGVARTAATVLIEGRYCAQIRKIMDQVHPDLVKIMNSGLANEAGATKGINQVGEIVVNKQTIASASPDVALFDPSNAFF